MKEYSDLELNKMIAELEGLTPRIVGGLVITNLGSYAPIDNQINKGTHKFNQNKARLYDLMVKYKVVPCYVANSCYIVDENACEYDSGVIAEVSFNDESEIQRAIIMCILKSKNII